MLKRILIINSDIYAKADITLDQTGSLQLVGENNVGKSSLINTLNFLYIIDQRHMKFEADRSLQDSLQHYFPSVQTSFLLFELLTDRTYCILVRRTANNQIEYYLIPQAYEERLFFIKKGTKQTVTSFVQLTETLENEHIPLQKLSSLQLYNKIYSQDEKENPLVQLSSNATRKGQSLHNHFTQIYKHLIRSSDISASDLTHFLLTAFNKAETKLAVFADTNNDSLQKLKKIGEKIESLQAIKPDFDKLITAHEAYEGHTKDLSSRYYTFLHYYPKTMQQLADHQEDIKVKINHTQKLQEEVRQEVRIFNQQIGTLKGKISYYTEAQTKVQQKLAELAPYDTPLARKALMDEIKTLQKEQQALESIIERVGQAKDAKQHLNQQIQQLEAKCIAKEKQIKSFGQPLIQHITKDSAIRNRLTALLSPEVLYSDKDKIKKKITKLSDSMALFDGIIDISDITSGHSLVNLEGLQVDLQEAQSQLTAARKLAQETSALETLQKSLGTKLQVWQSLERKGMYAEEEQKLASQITVLQKEIKGLEEKIAQQEASEKLHTQAIDKYKKEALAYDSKIEYYQDYRRELDKASIIPLEELCEEDDLKRLYKQLKRAQQARDEQDYLAKKLFDTTRQKITAHRYDQDRSRFIQEVRQELGSLDKLAASETELRAAVLNNFIQPTYTFLASYREFKKRIKRFSDQLSKHRISGIHKIELHVNELASVIEDLDQISQTDRSGTIDFTKEITASSLEKIQYYISRQATFELQDLFRLELRITTQENSRPIRMRMDKQIMSYGTNKVLRLIICLQLLQELVISKSDSPIVIYVDEVGTLGSENIQKLLLFCQEVNVLPIFAATRYTEGFEKYYPLIPSAINDGKVWVDEIHATRIQKENK